MEQPGPSTGRTSRKRVFRTSSLAEIASKFVEVLENDEQAACKIDIESGCKYTQQKLDINNFIRHFRTQHSEKAIEKGLLSEEIIAKKQRVVAKRSIAIDQQLLLEVLVKLVAYHNLPISFVEWEGMVQLLEPLKAALDVSVNKPFIQNILSKAAMLIKEDISKEVKGLLVSLKIDSASRHNRHVLALLAQYAFNGTVTTRILGMIEVKERQTAAFLKEKVLEIIKQYGLHVEQVFSVTCDNGANMVAAVRQLKLEYEMDQLSCLMNDENVETEQDTTQDIEENKLTVALGNEFQENLNLVRCAVHTLQLAILDVVNKSNYEIRKFTDVAKKCRAIKFKSAFEIQGARYPPVWGATRWGGIFEMVSCFLSQRTFFDKLAEQFPEIDLSRNWAFAESYEEAFKPLFICTKNMQISHISLSEFYLQWLISIQKVKKMASNPFSGPLVKALTTRLASLRGSRAFKMAIYLDPRLNFAGSTLFSNDEKEEIQGYIVETWNRIRQTRNPSASTLDSAVSTVISIQEENEGDQFITELFGGSTMDTSISNDNNFNQQLKSIEVEPRRNVNFDVWNYWTERKTTHPELSAVAAVVLATPSNQVSVERAFSALALVLTNIRSKLGEETISNILMIKLNKEVFEKISAKLLK